MDQDARRAGLEPVQRRNLGPREPHAHASASRKRTTPAARLRLPATA